MDKSNLLYSRPRLLLMVMLSTVDECNFNFLKKELHFADGTLSLQLKKLENAKFITIKKSFIDNRPNTSYKITAKGTKALVSHLSEMDELFTIVKKYI